MCVCLCVCVCARARAIYAINIYVCIYKTVKSYPITGFDMPLGLQAREGGNVSPRHRPPLPQKISLVLISVRG